MAEDEAAAEVAVAEVDGGGVGVEGSVPVGGGAVAAAWEGDGRGNAEEEADAVVKWRGGRERARVVGMAVSQAEAYWLLALWRRALVVWEAVVRRRCERWE
jgi:hypothetical protein